MFFYGALARQRSSVLAHIGTKPTFCQQGNKKEHKRVFSLLKGNQARESYAYITALTAWAASALL